MVPRLAACGLLISSLDLLPRITLDLSKYHPRAFSKEKGWNVVCSVPDSAAVSPDASETHTVFGCVLSLSWPGLGLSRQATPSQMCIW